MNENKFIERRKEHRLPYFDKVIFSDGTNTLTAHAINISRGGVFVTTMDSLPIDTIGYMAFMVASHSMSLCVRARIAHIVFDKQRCEVECGMGVQFLELSKSNFNILNLHILNDQSTYLELREILKDEKPDPAAVTRLRRKLPGLERYDLLGLRYRVNRVCTIFDQSNENTNTRIVPGLVGT